MDQAPPRQTDLANIFSHPPRGAFVIKAARHLSSFPGFLLQTFQAVHAGLPYSTYQDHPKGLSFFQMKDTFHYALALRGAF